MSHATSCTRCDPFGRIFEVAQDVCARKDATRGDAVEDRSDRETAISEPSLDRAATNTQDGR
jgi:hypothetical protein